MVSKTHTTTFSKSKDKISQIMVTSFAPKHKIKLTSLLL